ncbi:MAG: NADPH-dependent F420 reductase [SAR202 cluster bacterium]|nr:NADPH-dependent F420 reductase [SAR202 cluster bacterium]
MISFIGGTGPEGKGLALRFAIAGERVFIGSRDAERGLAAATEIQELLPAGLPKDYIRGGANEEAANTGYAQLGDAVFIAVPYAAHKDTLKALTESLKNKVIVDVVVPLAFEKGRASATIVEAGSAAEEAAQILPNSKIVSAFHNISAADLMVPDRSLDCDVIVCSDDDSAKTRIMGLAEMILGVRAVNGGGLANSRYVEDLTALLLNINRTYKAHSSIRITGI